MDDKTLENFFKDMQEIKITDVKMKVVDDFYKSNPNIGTWNVYATPRINAEILKLIFEVVKELKDDANKEKM